MTLPTATSSIRLVAKGEQLDAFGDDKKFVDVDTQVAYTSHPLERTRDLDASGGTDTDTIYDSTNDDMTILRGVLEANAAVDVLITDETNTSTRKLAAGWPMFLGAESGVTRIQVQITSGTARVKASFWE